MLHVIGNLGCLFFLCLPIPVLFFCIMFIKETIDSDRRIYHMLAEDMKKIEVQERETRILRSFLLSRGNVYLTAHSFSFGSEAAKDYVIQVAKKHGVWSDYYDN